ncbi:MAG: hypothetical protein D6812_09485 [Deltaproteobacteria bacterium]|nr:MAG: hypothetical protein D6812_09485 [Deltaproteobacteria bacterium]
MIRFVFIFSIIDACHFEVTLAEVFCNRLTAFWLPASPSAPREASKETDGSGIPMVTYPHFPDQL